MNLRRRALAFVVGLALTSMCFETGCDEIGNPLPGTSAGGLAGQLVRENDSAVGPLVIEARYVAPEQLHDLLTALGDEVDHVDAHVPPRGVVVVLMVRPKERTELPAVLHLVSDFGYPGGVTDRRFWVARTDRARFIGVFGLRQIPVEVRTTTM